MGRQIGSLWLKEAKGGMKYYSGVIEDIRGDIRIAVFKNNRKEKENQPDYQIVLSDDRKDAQGKPAEQTAPVSPGPEGEKEIRIEDIPF